MKQKLFIFIFIAILIALLVGLNAASYVQTEKTPDTEASPNRSTFNAGTTGTQAFYTLLNETGRRVTRWQEPPAALFTAGANAPAVFVVIGKTRREITEREADDLLQWVSYGGRLIVIDREPLEELAATTSNWKITITESITPELFSVDPGDQKEMTGDNAAIKAVQPTLITQNVNAVQPSRFASSIVFIPFSDPDSADPVFAPPPEDADQDDDTIFERSEIISRVAGQPQTKSAGKARQQEESEFYTIPEPTPVPPPPIAVDNLPSPSQLAPLVHFANGDRNLVVEVPFGDGRIVFLSDPFIVSNSGISIVDNAQLGINLVNVSEGTVAFDEYHQGYGADSNRFIQFFEGTPVIAIFIQALLLIGLVFYSQSRRFARPVPELEPDRLSKLEYVAAMAELQRRTKAFDLAIENIYNEFRRRAARYFGLDNYTAKGRDIARRIAERGTMDEAYVAGILFKCEEIIRGEPTNKHEVLKLARELRAIEQALGMTRARKTRI